MNSEIFNVVSAALTEICAEFTDVSLPKHNKFVAEVITQRLNELAKEADNNVKLNATFDKPNMNGTVSANISLADTIGLIIDQARKTQ
jgi:hypothetical protein